MTARHRTLALAAVLSLGACRNSNGDPLLTPPPPLAPESAGDGGAAAQPAQQAQPAEPTRPAQPTRPTADPRAPSRPNAVAGSKPAAKTAGSITDMDDDIPF